jgi:hypothetical protein
MKAFRSNQALLASIVILCFYGCTWKTSANLQASQGSAIVGIVTPDALYLFTDSARSTIKPLPGATSELADLGSQKAWKIRRVIFAQAGLRSMKVNHEEYDFTEPARRLLETSNVFDPTQFSSAWKREIKKAINHAFVNNPANFRQLVHNGVKGVELVLGWFDSTSLPHLVRHHIAIEISTEDNLVLKDSDFEVQPGGAGRGSILLGAEAADIAPELTADRKTYSTLEELMGKGLYPDAANLIIAYAARRSREVGGAIQTVTLHKSELR